MASSNLRRSSTTIRRWVQCYAAMLAVGASVASGQVYVVELERLPSIEREFRFCPTTEEEPAPNLLAQFAEEIPPPAGPPAGDYVDPLYGDEWVPMEDCCCPSCGCACGGGPCANCASCGCYDPCDDGPRLGRFVRGLYRGLCCPDPCYEPCWNPLADAAFFVDAARPVTQSRFRWDGGYRMVLPDRAEYFWARIGAEGRPLAETELTYHDLTHYTEACVGGFSMFVEMSYRSLYPDVNTHTAGFGDITAGTKSLLFDCELMQISFQTKFITPVGNPMKGLGTGHLSIEPSILTSIKISEHMWAQTQLSEWIPIGGDPEYAGAILHYHGSVNRTLLGHPGGVHVVGTLEGNGWSFQDGGYTDPVLGPMQRASNYSYFSGGGGVRVFVCNKIDFGVASTMALGDKHWAEQLIRAEFRARF